MFKKIASNTIAQLIAKFFGAGLTLLTTYYTIRLAGLDLYGDLTRILIMIAVGYTAIDFGLNAEGIRSGTNDLEIKAVTTSIMFTRLLLSLLVIIFLNLAVWFLPGGYSDEVKNIFWLGSLAIFFQGIYASSNVWFQYKLSYWRSTISVAVGAIISTSFTLYFLKYSPTLFHLLLANTLGYLSMATCSLLLLPRSQFENLRIYDLRLVIPLLRRSLILGLILIASVLASKIDTIILGIFRVSREVGEYGFAYRIFDVILVLPVFVMNAVYPISVQENITGIKSKLLSNTSWVMAGIGIIASIFLWFGAPYVNLVKSDLVITTTVLRILAFSLPLFYVTAPLMWSLISKKKDKVVLGIYLIATILNGSLNLIFIPSFGATAAAIVTGATELFIFLSLLYFSKII